MKILLGVSGGIAAYKALLLTRLFVKAGHQVQVVMTDGAKAFVQPLSFQALSGHPVRDSLFDANQEAGMGHIELARWADQILIAPATAETLAKLRMGRADDLLTTLCLATDRPIMLAPAMNRLMWANAATRENVAVLKARGFAVLHPGSGEQACGEIGEGRMPEPEEILTEVERFQAELAERQADSHLLSSLWQGRNLLITAGPTYEDIDPVRFIGNRSSGKMGFAIAGEAAESGARVTLISGPVALQTPTGVERIDVRSAEEMFAEVQKHYQAADCFISAAAVADFRVRQAADRKLKKSDDVDLMTLNLVKNPDIVAWVASQKDKPFVVGFAAETDEVEAYARKKLERKKLDMICANQVGRGMGFERDDNRLTIMTAEEQQEFPLASKKTLSRQLLTFIGRALS
ncbi:bifunctional phosphopantothenoylcysteine decarboxylase/phosphopantothenate--cysteine ligase CoaBC [Thiomicrorhabdus sp.]|uniref:bifunctional phosphopantothenoylcysteine decarboxylase/phosphopantothenate--cysteine ligase CoaBC n=1 Tax=Thiomicrorhabdus sp. TaxID=2039724 RepID=UPI0029C73A5A|nr:bifunctional phosphopantothenoylcysteine decarboxylase/phosphopantothenate--cysteine ligase CoaBC [Thiomicrorhabdus sp.]